MLKIKKKKNKNNLLIVHGKADNPNFGWMNSLADFASSIGFTVGSPKFDKQYSKDMQSTKYFKQLEDTLKDTEDVVVVAHSLGTRLILGYLSHNYYIPTGKIKVILVSGIHSDNPEHKKHFQGDWELDVYKLEQLSNVEFTHMYSIDDDIVPVKYSKNLYNEIGGSEIILDGYGHFQSIKGINRVIELEELIQSSI